MGQLLAEFEIYLKFNEIIKIAFGSGSGTVKTVPLLNLICLFS